ncbi:serine hydrolase domain-containing protein [Flagellimonas sp.]|uniref:serine hydrolase domain-containing protein n=1 Tax=Flagellimonas sp. TaxID=2058762 RepID=UPI003B5CAD96
MKSLISFFRELLTDSPKQSLEGLSALEKADAMLHNLAVEAKVPGMAVTILKEGKIVLEKGYGYANLEKRTPVYPQNTLFRIASISKCITGIALAKMVEEGLVDLDSSFYAYVPYYPKKEYDFTLRQLAGHTAGIRSYRGKEFALNQPFSIKESIEVFKNDPLVFEPGKGYLYNSFDFVLLSLAMQEAAGIPFEDYVMEKVLGPLSMKNTHPSSKYDIDLKTKVNLSEFYTKTATGFKKAVAVNNNYKIAGGGYLSTSNDIAKLGDAILNQKLVAPKILKEVLTSQTVNGDSTYYGLGFQVSQDIEGKSFVGHVGNSVGAYSNFFVYPNEQTVISILINCTDPKVQNELDSINILFN